MELVRKKEDDVTREVFHSSVGWREDPTGTSSSNALQSLEFGRVGDEFLQRIGGLLVGAIGGVHCWSFSLEDNAGDLTKFTLELKRIKKSIPRVASGESFGGKSSAPAAPAPEPPASTTTYYFHSQTHPTTRPP
jgi:hypothetical protein